MLKQEGENNNCHYELTPVDTDLEGGDGINYGAEVEA